MSAATKGRGLGGGRGLRPVPLEERFWKKVEKRSGPVDFCWVWKAHVSKDGYGKVEAHGRQMIAHRVAYELLVDAIPAGLTLDHLCRNRACVNPAHLEPVTLVENVMRGDGCCVRNARKTHCPQGHELSGENLFVKNNGVSRACRECQRKAAREWARRDRAAKKARLSCSA